MSYKCVNERPFKIIIIIIYWYQSKFGTVKNMFRNCSDALKLKQIKGDTKMVDSRSQFVD